jgi:hypothetical protein
MLVMDEAFDMCALGPTTTSTFLEWWELDVAAWSTRFQPPVGRVLLDRQRDPRHRYRHGRGLEPAPRRRDPVSRHPTRHGGVKLSQSGTARGSWDASAEIDTRPASTPSLITWRSRCAAGRRPARLPPRHARRCGLQLLESRYDLDHELHPNRGSSAPRTRAVHCRQLAVHRVTRSRHR